MISCIFPLGSFQIFNDASRALLSEFLFNLGVIQNLFVFVFSAKTKNAQDQGLNLKYLPKAHVLQT